MSHGFSRIYTDNPAGYGVYSVIMERAGIGLMCSEATEKIIGIFYDVYNELPRPQFRRLLFDNERKKIRGNPCESVAKVSA